VKGLKMGTSSDEVREHASLQDNGSTIDVVPNWVNFDMRALL